MLKSTTILVLWHFAALLVLCSQCYYCFYYPITVHAITDCILRDCLYQILIFYVRNLSNTWNVNDDLKTCTGQEINVPVKSSADGVSVHVSVHVVHTFRYRSGPDFTSFPGQGRKAREQTHPSAATAAGAAVSAVFLPPPAPSAYFPLELWT